MVLEQGGVLENVLAIHQVLEHHVEQVQGRRVQVGQDVARGVHQVVEQFEGQELVSQWF